MRSGVSVLKSKAVLHISLTKTAGVPLFRPFQKFHCIIYYSENERVWGGGGQWLVFIWLKKVGMFKGVGGGGGGSVEFIYRKNLGT